MATEHSKAFHDSCVLKLCRVCSYKEKVRSNKRRPSVYRCEKFRDEILTVFGLNISSDEEGKHPSLLCTRCYRTIINSRKLQGGKPRSGFVSKEKVRHCSNRQQMECLVLYQFRIKLFCT